MREGQEDEKCEKQKQEGKQKTMKTTTKKKKKNQREKKKDEEEVREQDEVGTEGKQHLVGGSPELRVASD